jgi:hypothetical protein
MSHIDTFEIGTECNVVDKKITQYIQRNISKKFFDVCTELQNSKVPDSVILRGLSITLARCFVQVKETKGFDSEIAEIIDEVAVVLNDSIRRGVNFPSQAAALALVIQHVLGIDSENLE